MPDEQTEQPEQPPLPYPHFPPTSEGLAILYRDFGRLHHLAAEHALLLKKLDQQGRTLKETTDALQALHAPGRCVPVAADAPAEDGPTPMRTRQVRGG